MDWNMAGERDIPAQGRLPGSFPLGYATPRGGHDEMADGSGAFRPHWREFGRFMSELAPDDMAQRWDRAQRLIRENGVTYNVYGDQHGLDRPWQLDPVPLIVSAEEWRQVSAAVTQRARLIDRILADLYGKRDLVAEGLLPSALVHGHPAFLRPCHGLPVRNGIHLHLYAADLARSPDGQWWVVADRCEAPAGAGYALENRVIVSRTVPEFFRAPGIEPLTPFFHKLRETLTNLSPRGYDVPRVVLLTPGPYNETYFEHAYLARHLGCTLVEGEDLTVREDRVFLKTLEGLQPVDVILRRTDAALCDPLELLSHSALGVPGLVRAVRAGTVVVANALGAGLGESPALLPFLPRLARRLLGEDLRLPSVATWWCGQPQALSHTLANLDRLVLKQTAASPRQEPIFGGRLGEAERDRLAQRVMARPRDWVAQEQMQPTTAPVWSGGRLHARPAMLRVYCAAHGGDYVAMPGGLTRVAAASGPAIVSMQSGGGSKDTWVQSERPDHDPAHGQPAPHPRAAAPAVTLTRGARDLPSRVADNMFWLGRYIERSEGLTRLLRAALTRAEDGGANGGDLPMLLDILERLGHLPDDAPDEPLARVQALAAAQFDAEHGAGLKGTISRVQGVAAVVRDRLSVDTWRAIQRLHGEIFAVPSSAAVDLEEALGQLNAVILTLEALSGLAMENMTRGLGWRFLDIGRRLERAIHVLELLSGLVAGEHDVTGAALDALLEMSDSVMTYRSRYLSAPQFAPVVDLVLADESNPRSLAFQLAALTAHVDRLAAIRPTPFYGPDQRILMHLTGTVRTAEIEILTRADEDGGSRDLSAFLELLLSRMWELSEMLTREYFAHAQAHPQAGAFRREPLP